MILLKQKRKRLYVPPQIEVTEYENDLLDGVMASVIAPPQQGSGGFGGDDAKAGTSWIDDDDDYESYDDFDYHSYMKEQLW